MSYDLIFYKCRLIQYSDGSGEDIVNQPPIKFIPSRHVSVRFNCSTRSEISGCMIRRDGVVIRNVLLPTTVTINAGDTLEMQLTLEGFSDEPPLGSWTKEGF